MILAVLLNFAVLATVALLAWWLSGYDSKLTHEHPKADFIRRSIRCGVTIFLLEIVWLAPPTVILIILILAITWAGCIAEFVSHGFRSLTDPDDKRVFDPARNRRELDAVATLIRLGKKVEAIQLCHRLQAAGEVDPIALELTLEHLGVPQPTVKKINPLTMASQLRQQGKFNDAELILNSLLGKNPQNVDAAMMLMRLYAQDLHQPDKAEKILGALEKLPHVPVSHIEFARRSIGEWSNSKPQKVEAVAPPESLDELLTQGFFGTAIEVLEGKIRAQPQDFDLQMKLAEIYAVKCDNLLRAEKIICQLQTDGNFSPEQREFAQAMQKQWREAKSTRAA